MANLKQNRSQLFYYEGTLTADYADNSFQLQFTAQTVRIAAASADMEFSLVGGGAGGADDIDGTVEAGENIEFHGMQTSKIALRGNGSAVRVWAY